MARVRTVTRRQPARDPGPGPVREQGAGRLEAQGVCVHFDGIAAVDQVDLHVAQGEILGLIGPNGAGKTTLVNVLSGYQRASAGRVLVDDHDATAWRPQRLVRAGVVRTFQSARSFAELTVLENVQVGAVGIGVSPKPARRLARDLLAELGIEAHADERASLLSAGDERRLAVARALAAGPRFLLLDEPAAGLNEAESEFLVQRLLAVRERYGCGLIVIEHDMTVIMRLCGRIQVLDAGASIKVGSPDEVRRDPAVLEAYLGREEGEAADAAG